VLKYPNPLSAVKAALRSASLGVSVAASAVKLKSRKETLPMKPVDDFVELYFGTGALRF